MSKLGFNSKSLAGFKVWNIARQISSAFPPDNCLVSSLWFRVVSSKKAGLSKENSVVIAFKILPSPPYSPYLYLHDLLTNKQNIESGGLSSNLAPSLPLNLNTFRQITSFFCFHLYKNRSIVLDHIRIKDSPYLRNFMILWSGLPNFLAIIMLDGGKK